MSSSAMTVGRLAAELECRFPKAWADEWDNVGLVLGRPDRDLTGILLTLDATAEAIERAAGTGASVLVTHHPPFLAMPEPIRGAGPAGTLEAALRHDIAVISLHTNLDRSPEGAEALPNLLGLRVIEPLETAAERVSVIVTYTPPEAADAVRAAMAAAGAGHIGRYEGCSFTSEGIGRFSPQASANPVVRGSDGTAEVRIEMLAPLGLTAHVLEAARDAHPYEEPVVLATEGLRARGVARLGRLCDAGDSATLGQLADHASRVLRVSCRVWGDPAHRVQHVAVGNGSGGSLVPYAQQRADALLVGEVRYHDALAATAAGLGVIEAGHDATEWPMVRVLEAAVRELGTGVEVIAEDAKTGWWTTKGPNDV